MKTALEIVQKFFPKVTKVQNSDSYAEIHVTEKDVKASKTKDHKNCALATACKREFKADGVIMSRAIAYLIFKKNAYRFRVPVLASKQIKEFDKTAQFVPGIYELTPPRSKTIGKSHGGKKESTGKSTKHQRHISTDIRATLK